jgi:hypothetical protein
MGKYYMKAMYVNLCTAIRPLVILSIDMDCQEECNISIYIYIQFDASAKVCGGPSDPGPL